MTKNRLVRVLAFVLVVMAWGMSANATTVPVTFNFNSLSPSAGDNSSAIATYMNSVLTAAGCTGCSVSVHGAATDQTYNGDGHVTGPGTTGTIRSLTLGTSDGATASNTNSTLNTGYDTFIANTTDGRSQISQEIYLTFTGFKINGTVGFDYQIFPDGNCTALTYSGCGGNPTGGIYPNQPDLTFEAGTNTNGTDPLVTAFGTGGIQYGVKPGTTNGTAIHSPISTATGTELAPQYIGTWSGTLNNVSELDFVDWPATIGVDNLKITYTTPEPSVVELCPFLLGGVLFFRRRLVALG